MEKLVELGDLEEETGEESDAEHEETISEFLDLDNLKNELLGDGIEEFYIIKEESIENLAKKVIPEKDVVNELTGIEDIDYRGFKAELPRMGISGFNLISIPNQGSGKEKRYYSKEQINEVKGSFRKDDLKKAALGHLIKAEAKAHSKITAKGKTIEEVINHLSLPLDESSRERIGEYNANGALHLEELGISKIIASERRGIKEEDIRSLYLEHYGLDFPGLNNELKSKYGHVIKLDKDGQSMRLRLTEEKVRELSGKDGKDSVSVYRYKRKEFILGGIKLRASDKKIKAFMDSLITAESFASQIFPEHREYFTNLHDLDLEEFLKKEAGIYQAEKGLELLPAIKGKYHELDKGQFIGLMGKDRHDIIQKGLKLRIALASYEKKDSENFTIGAIAKLFSTSSEKMMSLDIAEDMGLIKQISESGQDYHALNNVYLMHLKGRQSSIDGKVEFNDSNIRDWRIRPEVMSEFTSKKFENSVLDVKKANEELKRQYEIDGIDRNKRRYIPEIFMPFRIGKKLVNTAQHNREIKKILEKKDIRKRIEWAENISYYQEDPGERYVKLEKVKDELGLNDKDWEKVKKSIRTIVPGVEEIKRIESTLKNKNMKKPTKDPEVFYKKYYRHIASYDNEYITKARFDRIRDNLVSRDNLSKKLTGIDADYPLLQKEMEIRGYSLEGLLHTVSISEKNEDSAMQKEERTGFYIRSNIELVKKNLEKSSDYRKIQIGLALRNAWNEAEEEISRIKYSSPEQAADVLGSKNIGILIEKELLKKKDISIAPILKKIIEQKYSIRMKEEEIREFYQEDGRYEFKLVKAITNLDEFLAKTVPISAVRTKLGSNWLGDIFYTHFLEQNNPVVLHIENEYKYHESNISRLQNIKLPRSMLRKAVANELKIEGAPKRDYTIFSDLPREITIEHIKSIEDSVEMFKSGCLSQKQILQKIGTTINSLVINKLMQEVLPGSTTFLNGKYHAQDISDLKNIIDSSAAKLKIDNKSFISMYSKDYFQLKQTGLENSEIKKLLSSSYSIDKLDTYSSSLAKWAKAKATTFTLEEKTYVHQDDLPVSEIKPEDITLKGINGLISTGRWIRYMQEEFKHQRNSHQKNSKEIAKLEKDYISYLMKSDGINPNEEFYDFNQFIQVNDITETLMDNNIHNINRITLKDERKREVDSQNTYYTSREAKAILGINSKRIARTGIPNIGGPQSGLYRLADIADYIRKTSIQDKQHIKNIRMELKSDIDLIMAKTMLSQGYHNEDIKKILKLPSDIYNASRKRVDEMIIKNSMDILKHLYP
ncbi:MAG: hypothetical protein KAK00_01590 [Nanoarchaeota archaeon]|nr:hypothetical protein [Nanoarchaeota archaeon]